MYHIRFPETFWIDASSEASIDSKLKQIAKTNNVSTGSVLHWISTRKNWLIVFDNADGGYEIVEKSLPPGDSGNILFTSRNDDLLRIVLKENSVEVCEMDEAEAISLLLKSASIGFEDSSANRALASTIVSKLGYIPLAIDQAGAYMHTNHCGPENYLDLYSNHCKQLLLHSSFKGASGYGNSIYETWELSMKEIESRATGDPGHPL